MALHNPPPGVIEAFAINALLRESLGIEGKYQTLQDDQRERLEWLKISVIINRSIFDEMNAIFSNLKFRKHEAMIVTGKASFKKAQEL